MEKNAEDVTVLGENYNNAAIYALLILELNLYAY